MKIIYILGALLLIGAAFCEEADDEQPSDEVADESAEDQQEDNKETSNEDDEDEEETENEDDEDEDARHVYKPKCPIVRYAKNCQRVCLPKYYYTTGVRRVKYCFNKLLSKTRRECRKFCWYAPGSGYGKLYRRGPKVCRKRCYHVPLTRKVCRYRKLRFPQWTFKNKCSRVCVRVPIRRCGPHRKY